LKITKLGLIGLGNMGSVHLQNCLRLQNARLTAVADVSKNALKRAKTMGVMNVYEDYRDLLSKSDVDAVIIALPTHLHALCAKIASESHKNIFSEKPLARNASEGREILSLANKHGVKLAVGYPLRFSLPFQEIKTKMESGELGEIQIAHATNIGTGPFIHRSDNSSAPLPVPEWWWKKELTGGGALLDLGSHMVNLVQWYFGEVAEAKSWLGYRLNMDQEDHAVCLLKCKRGQIVVISVGWFSQRYHLGLEVFGTFGSATTVRSPPNRMRTALQLFLRKPSGFNVPFMNEIQYFVDCLQTEKELQTSGEDALKDLEVIEKAYANHERLT
jgi:predicted dehydrogenase